MSGIVPKYDAIAERYSAHDYADAERYYARRAKLVVEHGPRLAPGDTLLDIACGDGGLGRHLLALGIDYCGVDASERMVEVARRATRRPRRARDIRLRAARAGRPHLLREVLLSRAREGRHQALLPDAWKR